MRHRERAGDNAADEITAKSGVTHDNAAAARLRLIVEY
jgi:hypothetical protein